MAYFCGLSTTKMSVETTNQDFHSLLSCILTQSGQSVSVNVNESVLYSPVLIFYHDHPYTDGAVSESRIPQLYDRFTL